MKTRILLGLLFTVYCIAAKAQTGNVVLIEVFTETGCGACSQYDSSFNAITNASADKIAVISYHCFYSGDPFYTFNKTGDQRYSFYQMKEGYPSAIINGKKPGITSSHLTYVKAPLIDKSYNQPQQFKFEIGCMPSGKGDVHSATINVKATALKDNSGKDLRLFVVATENNINYKERYHSPAVNGLNDFNHIMRAMLPDTNGIAIGAQIIGNVNKIKVTYINDNKETNFNEVQFVVFIQDINTKEIFGTAVSKEHLLK